MDKNLDNIAEELFAKLRSQFSKIKLGNEESDTTDEEASARSFEFPYEEQGRALGTVTVTISQEDGLVAIYSNDIMEQQSSFVKKRFFNFLKELREFAKQNFMSFDTRDIAKNNLEKRDYKHLSKKHGEGNMNESKLWGSARTSYQEIGEAKIIVKHSAPINFDNPAGRTQRIESIYIENAVGERFRYPFKHLNGARALAQHVNHGGNPYDSIGQYVVGLSEELANLRMFKGYVDRHPLISEAMGSVQTKVSERIDSVKKEIFTLQNPSHYSTFSESFVAAEKQEIPEDVMNDLVDRLTIRSFKEELKNVFPFIYNLIDESDIPVKTLGIEDLFTEETGKEELDYTAAKEVKEFADYEKFINGIAEDSSIFSDNEDAQSEAIDQLNQLIGAPMPVGVDGTNAIESIGELIDDDELMDVFKELADIDPESDARDILKDYITIKDQENGTDVLSQLNFTDEQDTPTAPPEPEMPAEEPVAAEPAPVDPAATQPPPIAEEKEDPPFDGPYKKPGDNKDRYGNTVKNPARHAAKKGMAAAIAKAKKAGATSETLISFGDKQITLETLVKMAGMQVEDVFGDKTKQSQGELIEFIKSMFDETTGQFPKGEEGVRIACEKKFGEDAVGVAEKVINRLQSVNEMNRVRQLAGMEEGYYDLNSDLPGMEPIDLSSEPSFKEVITRYTQLVYQGHAGTTSDEEEQEYNDIVQYVADRFGDKGSAHLQKAGEVSYWGRPGPRGGSGPRGDNLGRASQPSGDFRTTKAGKMHGQDAKVMKGKVADRLGKHPEPNLPESSDLTAMLKIAGLR